MSAIKLVFGTKTRGADIPRLSANYETNISGLYIAGELGGMGLLRNAVKQGAASAEHAISTLRGEKAKYDLVIVGAGAAGMAAALTAIAHKRSYLLIEQDKFGGTIAHFPRQKLVMSHPLELPGIGRARFESNTISKEDLMTFWGEVRSQTGLKVLEGTKFENVTKQGSIFHVTTSRGVVSAARVILCMGVRGSARKLGIPGEDLPKVTYNLIEPDQYRKKKIVIVGGGNSAAEAAVMLADGRRGNQVHMVVRGAGLDRCNDENRRKVEALVEKRQLVIWFDSHVSTIAKDSVTVERAGQPGRMPNDFVFIFAGAEMPRAFLMSLGVQVDKKFGEGYAG
jgi:thioredoxin reductase